ncbi:hypothetical protein BD779DRAFT_1802051 [Infundibulicybe gibba]|nr:hypothetical protein BD779DRAFT_1802051 [Infundibulicybe gibba]
MAPSLLQILYLLKQLLSSTNVVRRYLLKYLRILWDNLQKALLIVKERRVHGRSGGPHISQKHDPSTSEPTPFPDAIAASSLPQESPSPIVIPLAEALVSDTTNVAAVNTSSAVLEAGGMSVGEAHSSQVVTPPAENLGDQASLSRAAPHNHLYPITPTEFRQLYERAGVMKPFQPRHIIRPNQQDFPRPGELPSGWVEYIHWEGRVFFYHSQKRIITYSWLWDAGVSDQIAVFTEKIEVLIRSQNLTLPEDSDLVLKLVWDTEGQLCRCGYYYVRHSTKTLFWLESFDVSPFVAAIKSNKLCPSHIRNYLESEYWYNWALFPNIYPVTIPVLIELENMLRDAQTSDVTQTLWYRPASNHSFEDLENMMQIVKGVRENMTPEHSTSGFVGRFMYSLWRDRFFNFYGQKTARYSHNWSMDGVRPGTLKRSPGFRILSLFFFHAPRAHLNMMDELWVDGLITQPYWKHFNGKLNSEWVEHIAYSFILLNANIALLAVPGGGSAVVLATNYLSTAFSLIGIIIGLLLIRKHRARDQRIASFFFCIFVMLTIWAQRYKVRGQEGLAIVYSLPYALLIYGIILFFASSILLSFSSLVSDVIIIFSASFIFWTVYVIRDEPEDHPRPPTAGLWIHAKIRSPRSVLTAMMLALLRIHISRFYGRGHETSGIPALIFP